MSVGKAVNRRAEKEPYNKRPIFTRHAARHVRATANARSFLDTRDEVLAVLDDVLSLKGRTAAFRDDTPLLGSVPELDSMAVANVLASLEERFGIVIDDDDIDATTFATVGSLVAYVRSKLEAAG